MRVIHVLRKPGPIVWEWFPVEEQEATYEPQRPTSSFGMEKGTGPQAH